MVMYFGGGDPEQADWQGDGVDVEISRINWRGRLRFQWSLYHQARLIKTGMRRSLWGAQLAGQVATWWYRWSL